MASSFYSSRGRAGSLAPQRGLADSLASGLGCDRKAPTRMVCWAGWGRAAFGTVRYLAAHARRVEPVVVARARPSGPPSRLIASRTLLGVTCPRGSTSLHRLASRLASSFEGIRGVWTVLAYVLQAMLLARTADVSTMCSLACEETRPVVKAPSGPPEVPAGGARGVRHSVDSWDPGRVACLIVWEECRQ